MSLPSSQPPKAQQPHLQQDDDGDELLSVGDPDVDSFLSLEDLNVALDSLDTLATSVARAVPPANTPDVPRDAEGADSVTAGPSPAPVAADPAEMPEPMAAVVAEELQPNCDDLDAEFSLEADALLNEAFPGFESSEVEDVDSDIDHDKDNRAVTNAPADDTPAVSEIEIARSTVNDAQPIASTIDDDFDETMEIFCDNDENDDDDDVAGLKNTVAAMQSPTPPPTPNVTDAPPRVDDSSEPTPMQPEASVQSRPSAPIARDADSAEKAPAVSSPAGPPALLKIVYGALMLINLPLVLVPESLRSGVDIVALTLLIWAPLVWLLVLFVF
ncbi:MAG: hypothetical protein ACR2GY_11110 [Phycisphaerales bacterium]